jgi:nucleoside-diphosphate-sugar epimerase
MRILITGGNGFLGSNIVRKLIKENHNLYVFSKSTNNIQDILDKIKFDFSSNNELVNFEEEIIKFSPEIVIHCGWSGGNSYQDVNDLNQLYENVEPSVKLLETLNQLPNKPKFIGFGSFSEYGNLPIPINENDTEQPINLYGLSKLTFKNYSKMLCDNYGMEWVWVRPCYIYGPNDVKTRLIPLLVNKLLNDQEIILDDCNKVIDYLYIDDFVNYFYSLTQNSSEGVYNICSGKQYNLKELILSIHNISESKSKITFNSELNRKFTSSHICGDNTKISTQSNHSPQVDINQGVLSTINYYKKLL